jgi:hypothetical protein
MMRQPAPLFPGCQGIHGEAWREDGGQKQSEYFIETQNHENHEAMLERLTKINPRFRSWVFPQ